jgi:hypothetical protein
MGKFLLKSHHSAKLLDSNHVCERTFSDKRSSLFVPSDSDKESKFENFDNRLFFITMNNKRGLYHKTFAAVAYSKLECLTLSHLRPSLILEGKESSTPL